MSTTVCPGCGLVLARRDDAPPPGRHHASPECLALLGEVSAREIEHAAILGTWHQMTVDAYGAQHAGKLAPRIGPAFALIGLCLALERGRSGPEVRDAHGYLARTKRAWPSFVPPAGGWSRTVADVAATSEPQAHAAAVAEWGRSVWDAWSADHGRVRRTADELLRDWRPG